MRHLTCSECGSVFRVLKEATTGAPITSFVCLPCLAEAPADQPSATILQFPAAGGAR